MELQAPKGTRDMLPQDAYLWQYVEDKMRRLAALWGYDVNSIDRMLDTLDGALQACLPGLLQAIGVLLISVFGSAWLLDRYVSL